MKRFIGWGVPSDRILIVVYGDTEAHHPVNVNERRVVMFASDRPIRQLVTASMNHGLPLTAMWTDHGAAFQQQPGLGQPRGETVAARR